MSAPRVLVVGAGGLGAPAALCLARAGVAMTLVDDDLVETSNLHRQILFDDADVGAAKAPRAAARLRAVAAEHGHALDVAAVETRFRPDTARELLEGHALLLEGADNLPTKFLAADAARLHRVPCVQAGVVRWSGWALATHPDAGACLRCVFEDVPTDRVETCAEAGVVGPVVGVLGALQALLASRLLEGDLEVAGVVHHYRALSSRGLRRRRVRRRPGCPLCRGEIRDLRPDRYLPPSCAA